MEATKFSANNSGLRVVIYPGDNKILIAMSLEDNSINDADKNLAGFAIWRKYDGKPEQILQNRIGFTVGVNNRPPPNPRMDRLRQGAVPEIPLDRCAARRFQQPHHLPGPGAVFHRPGLATKAGPEVPSPSNRCKQICTQIPAGVYPRLHRLAGLYRQIPEQGHPAAGPNTPDFNTKPFQPQYPGLAPTRGMQLFDFIADCENDTSAQVNVFAYDLDEPDIIAAICRMGKQGRLRAILDNAIALNPTSRARAARSTAAKMIIAAAGTANVRQGKFARYQHNKVFIKRDSSRKRAEGDLRLDEFFRARHLRAGEQRHRCRRSQSRRHVRPGIRRCIQERCEGAALPHRAIAKGYMVCSATDTADLPKFSLALVAPHGFRRFRSARCRTACARPPVRCSSP